jgi:hypothetical protein
VSTTEIDLDYRKYHYALAQERLVRACEIIDRIVLDATNSEDLNATLMRTVMDDMRRAVFLDAEPAESNRLVDMVVEGSGFDMAAYRAAEGHDTYADGRPVTTTLHYGDADDEYITHVWHPDPRHPLNQVGAIIDYSQGPYPYRHRHVLVTGQWTIEVALEVYCPNGEQPLTEEEVRRGIANRLGRHDS